MTPQISWFEMLEAREKDLLVALESAFAAAGNHGSCNDYTEDVIMDKYGEIRRVTGHQSEIPWDILEGSAICVDSFKWFEPTDDGDIDREVLDFIENNDLKHEFAKWCEENHCEIIRAGRHLRSFSKTLWEQYKENYREWYIGKYAEGVADEALVKTIQRWESITEYC